VHNLSTHPMLHFLVKLGIGAAVGWIADNLNSFKLGGPRQLASRSYRRIGRGLPEIARLGIF
jgi:hypothetical protein